MGKRVCFTGHRPDKLYGYSLNHKLYQKLAWKVYYLCEQLILNEDVDEFISGGALGFDTVSFFAIDMLKKKYPHIKNIIAIPYAKQRNPKWSDIDKDRYDRMLSKADKLIYVDEEDGYNRTLTPVGEHSDVKLDIRNQYMVDTSFAVIGCWNGDLRGGTYNCISYSKGLDDFKKVLIINPNNLDEEVFDFSRAV